MKQRTICRVCGEDVSDTYPQLWVSIPPISQGDAHCYCTTCDGKVPLKDKRSGHTMQPEFNDKPSMRKNETMPCSKCREFIESYPRRNRCEGCDE